MKLLVELKQNNTGTSQYFSSEGQIDSDHIRNSGRSEEFRRSVSEVGYAPVRRPNQRRSEERSVEALGGVV